MAGHRISQINLPINESLTLKIDNREHKLVKLFQDIDVENLELMVDTLEIGDYILYSNEIPITIFERKTWGDLASTLRTDRKYNIEKLLRARESHNCPIIYVVEGKKVDRKYVNIAQLQSHLDHIMLRDGIHVIYTRNRHHTMNRILQMVRNIRTIKPKKYEKYGKSEVKVVGGKLSMSRDETFEDQKNMLYSIDGISLSVATKMVSDGFTMNKFLSQSIDIDSFNEFKTESGRRVNKKIRTLLTSDEFVGSNKWCETVLMGIRGISAKTASIIAKTFNLGQLNVVDRSDLEQLKVGKCVLRSKIIDKILQLLQ